MNKKTTVIIGAILILLGIGAGVALLATADDSVADSTATTTMQESTDDTTADDTLNNEVADTTASPESFTIDVWADNWFALYVNGEMVGEDSVPITTERSFNKETFSFTATRPMTVAFEAKDYKETDSGLEYIGASNQQMGDGGIIAQIKDASGQVVGTTDANWTAYVTHFAPLDKSCESSSNPATDCAFEITDTPSNWFAVNFDDSSWASANLYTAADVDPKIGYDEVNWDSSAQFIWGEDLEQVNTVLLRTVIE